MRDSCRRRERIVAQQQATLEAEIALEELRLQRLPQREEAERLEGPFNRAAGETSRDRQRRRDAEAARRVVEGLLIEEKRRGWTSLLLEAAGRGRPARMLKGEARQRIRIETLPPPSKNDRPCYRRR